MTVQSRDLSPYTSDVLQILDGGHPAKIMKLACDFDEVTIAALRNISKNKN